MNYIYCLIENRTKENFGNIGIEDKEVYTIPYLDISLVVHDSDNEPRLSKEDHVICHQYIINLLTMKSSTIIPFPINTFIKKEKAIQFLEKNYETFKKRLEKIKDKAEFVVQIFYEPKPKKAELEVSVKDYMLKQKKLRAEVINEIAELSEKFYNHIKEVADDIKIRNDKEENKPLLSVSCLIHKNGIERFKGSLKEISNIPGISICLSGPWAVCSFA